MTTTSYVLDTSAYSELLCGHSGVAKVINEASVIYLPHVAMAELQYGFRLGLRRDQNEKLLNRFVAHQKVHVLLPDNATTDYFVDIAEFAHRKGMKLSSHDMWIAALAVQWDAKLVTFDNDFAHLAHKDVKLWDKNKVQFDNGQQTTRS